MTREKFTNCSRTLLFSRMSAIEDWGHDKIIVSPVPLSCWLWKQHSTSHSSFLSKMETLTLYNIIILIFTVIAFVSNLGSLIYVTKTFDIKQSFFHILIMDAIVVIGSTLLSSITIVLVIFGQILGKFCGCLLFGAAITVLSSPMSFIMISFIR